MSDVAKDSIPNMPGGKPSPKKDWTAQGDPAPVPFPSGGSPRKGGKAASPAEESGCKQVREKGEAGDSPSPLD